MSLIHGGRLLRAIQCFGGCREDWLDLSTGISPIAYPFDPSRLGADVWTRLPEREQEEQTEDAARVAYGVHSDNAVLVAPGIQAVLGLLPDLFKGAKVAVVSPTYGEHEYRWREAGNQVHAVADHTCIDASFNGAVVVNPNNPDGRCFASDDLRMLGKRLQFLVIDEAFEDVKDRINMASQPIDNIIILRSFGKFFGLAGLRLGFVIGNEKWISKLRDKLGPWAVSGPALSIGQTALEDWEWQQRAGSRHRELAKRLGEILQRHSFSVVGRTSLFVLAAREDAAGVFEYLCGQKILVRTFEKHPEWIRFGLADGEGLNRLEEALGRV